MMRQGPRFWATLAVLLLPLLAAGAHIFWQQQNMRGSSQWIIPISGYDPRDPLRGRFVAFQYDWQLQGDPAQCVAGEDCHLCLSASLPADIVAQVVPESARCDARVDVDASRIRVRPGFGTGPDAIFTTRIFVSEASAPGLERQLQQGPMAVEAVLGRDGRLIPRKLVPLPD